MKRAQKILKWLGFAVGTYCIVLLAYVAYGHYREPIAKAEAEDFCATVKVGDSTAGIVDRALQAGSMKAFAKWSPEANNERTLLAIFVGMPPYSRHICAITATDVVVRTSYSHLD